MRYTVIWKPPAEQELADLWMNAEDRNVITDAADQIDDLLRQDAGELGESRTGPIRRMFVPPLGVAFEVREADRLVLVLSVWRFRIGKHR